jgi:hypothetical protein
LQWQGSEGHEEQEPVHKSNGRGASAESWPSRHRRAASSMVWRCGLLPLIPANTHPTHWLIYAQAETNVLCAGGRGGVGGAVRGLAQGRGAVSGDAGSSCIQVGERASRDSEGGRVIGRVDFGG